MRIIWNPTPQARATGCVDPHAPGEQVVEAVGFSRVTARTDE